MSITTPRSQESADAYVEKRFEVSPRMARLDLLERRFATEVMAMLENSAVVLDIPCGNGRFVDILGSAKTYLMFDYAPTMLRAALKQHHDKVSPSQMAVADVTCIPLESNSVDLTFCMRLFHHVTQPELRIAALSEMARVTRCYVAFSFYCTESWRYLRRRIRGKKPSGQAIPTRQMIAEAESVGLKFVRRFPKLQFVEQQRLMLFKRD